MSDDTKPYQVFPYSIETLKTLLAERSGAKDFVVEQKLHSYYFDSYFAAVKAKTIVVETDYIDKFFTDDYAGYYVRCFGGDYKRRCSRFHFFDIAFSERDLAYLLDGSKSKLSQEKLNTAYCGFVVVKPLPKTFVGRTCLKTYPSLNGQRHYPITRQYSANLFGIKLEVSTLPFQEQDTVAAACATSALWSVFNGTATLFQHSIPSPLEITKAAKAGMPARTRTFPNENGLTAEEMAQAIRNVGMEPFSVSVRDNYITKSTLYAYLNGKVPVLMLGPSANANDSENGLVLSDLGGHAIAATGYGLSSDRPTPYGEGFLLRSSRINRIYAHDDQVGPFTSMYFENGPVVIDPQNPAFNLDYLSVACGPDAKNKSGSVFIPQFLLIPLTTTIRIPFEVILNVVIDFDSIVEWFRSNEFLSVNSRIEWDICLTSGNDYKAGIFDDIVDVPGSRHNVLTTHLPKFIWRATAYEEKRPLIDLLFDTTDVKQGSLLISAVPYDTSVFADLIACMVGFCATPVYTNIFRSKPSGKVFSFLAELNQA